MTKSFTSQVQNDLRKDLSSEDITRMYAAWGRFIELSTMFIPWNNFLDYSEPMEELIETREDGTLVYETTIKLRYSLKVPTNEELSKL